MIITGVAATEAVAVAALPDDTPAAILDFSAAPADDSAVFFPASCTVD